jgi:mono/diheme cytochrome c family protein
MTICIARRTHLYSLLLSLYSLSLLSCHSTPPPKPLAELNAHEAHGYRVFAAHCAQCHYDRQEGPLHGPSLLGIYKKPYLPSGAPANDDRVIATIQHGRKMMPAQSDLDPNDLDDLLAYLHTL